MITRANVNVHNILYNLTNQSYMVANSLMNYLIKNIFLII